jgi:hypothetical protein
MEDADEERYDEPAFTVLRSPEVELPADAHEAEAPAPGDPA